MSKEHKIATVLDMLKLSEDEFGRMLPDLVAWYCYCRQAEAMGAQAGSFTWVDDGKGGEIHSVDVRIVDGEGKPTGDVRRLKGSAYVEPKP